VAPVTDELGEAADRATYSPPAAARPSPPAAGPGWADELANLSAGEILTGSVLAGVVYAAAMFGCKLLARAVAG
jgi:hypothetical protein